MREFLVFLTVIGIWALLWIYSRLQVLEWSRQVAEDDGMVYVTLVESKSVTQKQQPEEAVVSKDTSVEEPFGKGLNGK